MSELLEQLKATNENWSVTESDNGLITFTWNNVTVNCNEWDAGARKLMEYIDQKKPVHMPMGLILRSEPSISIWEGELHCVCGYDSWLWDDACSNCGRVYEVNIVVTEVK